MQPRMLSLTRFEETCKSPMRFCKSLYALEKHSRILGVLLEPPEISLPGVLGSMMDILSMLPLYVNFLT